MFDPKTRTQVKLFRDLIVGGYITGENLLFITEVIGSQDILDILTIDHIIDHELIIRQDIGVFNPGRE